VRDAGAMSLSDDEMVEAVKREMGGVLGLRGQPAVSRVFRWPGGLPQLEVGHLERMAAVEKEVAAVPGLHLTGGGIRTSGIPDAVADGTRAGEAAAEDVR
jgi:protoporphyrinogen/coproporphyrinogen III oxidase